MSEINPAVKTFLEKLYQGTFEDLEDFGQFVGATSVEPFQLSHGSHGQQFLIVEVKLREISGPLPVFRVLLATINSDKKWGPAGTDSKCWAFDFSGTSMGFTDAAIALHIT
jgi:hypothetical protein